MTNDRLAYLAELIDRAVFRMKAIGMTDDEITDTFINAAKSITDRRLAEVQATCN